MWSWIFESFNRTSNIYNSKWIFDLNPIFYDGFVFIFIFGEKDSCSFLFECKIIAYKHVQNQDYDFMVLKLNEIAKKCVRSETIKWNLSDFTVESLTCYPWCLAQPNHLLNLIYMWSGAVMNKKVQNDFLRIFFASKVKSPWNFNSKCFWVLALCNTSTPTHRQPHSFHLLPLLLLLSRHRVFFYARLVNEIIKNHQLSKFKVNFSLIYSHNFINSHSKVVG